MKRTALALIALAALPLYAQEKKPLVCTPPEAKVCGPTVGHSYLCLCVVQTGAQCKVVISYPANKPPEATVELSPGCDRASFDFAIAVILSKHGHGMPTK